jgi:hypothetical protein
MTLGEIKDVVREHYGRIGWSTVMLDEALASARREVEKYSNVYWMRASATFNTVASTQDYTIGSGDDIDDSGNFKDARAFHIKESADTVWTEVEIGNITQEEASLMFPTDETGMPLLAVLDDLTIYLYPKPDDAYNCKLWYWEWTSNPSANTGSDELTKRFPEALIYGALIWGSEQYEKDYQLADRWRALFGQELSKIHRHSLERERQDRITFMPMTGPYAQRRRSEISRQVWL